ncbi:MAG: hypothetical protein P4L55_14460 [Syntrophobacteraceae bacterium]|nr:hypothetical protein [Syntrophobacteraceae bacterium]
MSPLHLLNTKIDEVVQRSAEPAEGSASTSEEMKTRARELKTLVEELRLMARGGFAEKVRKNATSRPRVELPQTNRDHAEARPPSVKSNSGSGRGSGRKKMSSPRRTIPWEGQDLKEF